MFRLPFGEKRILSIDLGSISTKIVEIVKKKESLEVVNFGVIPVINFKEIASYSYILEENIASILSEFLKASKVKAKEIVISVPAPYVFAVNFLVPDIPEKSLPQVIRFESQKQIPLSLEEIELDYRYLHFDTENQSKQWLVYLVGTPKNHLKRLQTITEIAKLKLIGYSAEYFNIEPFFRTRLGTYAVVDLGHSYSLLCLLKNGKIIYGNKLKIRGYDFLDTVMNLTNYSEEDTLNLIYKKGFNFSPEEKELNDLANDFLNNITDNLTNEIEKLENSFFLKIEKIYWTGGISILPGFKEVMLSRLGKYQQEILLPYDIFKGEKFSKLKEKATIFSQALGVAFHKLMS
ncbi:MAG: pilus assembly protein PilM [Candidatus Parcubacteria bacterium]|nr:MAG: pilus assembly protein PilM [Candidatus Parcubacteria bacterium]